MNKFDALSPMEDFNNNIAKTDTPKARKRKKIVAHHTFYSKLMRGK